MANATKNELKLLELERMENREREQPQLQCRLNSFGDRDAGVYVDFVDGSRRALHLAVLLQGRGNWYHGSRHGAFYPSQAAPLIMASASAPSSTITGTFPEWEADQLMDVGCWAGVAWTSADGKRRRWGAKFDANWQLISEPLTGITAG